jgi:RNA polymerase sigma-70 factor, ECF subfamily
MVLSRAFCAARPTAAPSPELEGALARAASAGRQAWPALAVGDEAFAAYLGARVGADDPVEGLADCHAADLWLACACAQGNPAALEAFAGTHLSRLASYLSKSRAEALADDVRQILLARFFVADGGPPKILEYSGRGPLGAWVRVAAVRTALSLQRAPRRTDEPLAELVGPMDPELDGLKLRLRGAFEEALAFACAKLSDRDHTLLRLHYAERVPVEGLARVYKVHRVSVSRWLADARAQLLEGTRARLRTHLALTDSEFVSVTRLVQSQLDVSLGQLLGTRAPSASGTSE